MIALDPNRSIVAAAAASNLEHQFKKSEEQLEEILDCYHAWDDPLSKEIHAWGNKQLLSTELSPFDSSHMEISREWIRFLAKTILMDSFLLNPLSTPMLDRTWVWEKSVLTFYKKHSTISPFDLEKIEDRPHLFAIDILKWIRELPWHQEPVSDASKESQIDVQSSQDSLNVQTWYEKQAVKSACDNLIYRKNAIRVAHSRKLTLFAKAQANALIPYILAQREKNRLAEETAIKEGVARSAALQTKLATIASEQQNKVDAVNNAIEEKENDLQKLNGNVAQKQLTVQQHAQRIANIRSQIAEEQREIERLRRKIKRRIF